MENFLREHKIKITPQRMELIRILKELGNTHPSFNGIYQSIKATHPNVSRSTVYENLKLLVELGVIRSFHYKGEIRYEMDPEPHVNLAEPDGTITDIKNRAIQKHLAQIQRILKEEEGIELKTLLVIAE
ncbi:MAG: transcriptional repressor [Methanobacteriaceae archaeon]|nr:transcriptional repressor [Methanobacteriaceae archaeon]